MPDLIFAAAVMLSVTTSEIYSTDVYGGPGGGDFYYQCADNGYLVGLKARGGTWIDSVQAICAKYDPKSGTMYGHSPEGPVFGGPGGGDMGNADSNNPCGPNDIVYGHAIRENKGERYLGYISLICVNSVTRSPPPLVNNNAARFLIQGTGNFRYTDSGTPLNDVCAPGDAAIGIRGRAGSYVDAFGLVCAPLGWPAAPKFSVKTNAPGDVTFFNPVEYAPTGQVTYVDSCLSPGKKCGEPAAERYCRDARKYRYDGAAFQYVVDFKLTARGVSTLIPYPQRTVCSGGPCVGFAEIRCSTKKPFKPGLDPSQTGGVAIGDLDGIDQSPADINQAPDIFPGPATPDKGAKVGNGWTGFTHYFAADFTGDKRADLLVRAANGDVKLYPFGKKDDFYSGAGPIAYGNSWNFADYWPADWSGDGRADILARSPAGEAFLYETQTNNTSYGGVKKSAEGWTFPRYFVGDFNGDKAPDIVGRSANGDLTFLSLYAQLLPSKVGKSAAYTHYLSGDFTGDGKDDLLGRTAAGDLMLHAFGAASFGAATKVGNGWSFTHYWPGDWTKDGKADLMVRAANGDVLLYPIGGSFYDGGGPVKVGEGWNFSDYFAADFSGDGAPDFVGRTASGDLIYFPWKGMSF